MDLPSPGQDVPARPADAPASSSAAPSVESQTLLGGRRELLIRQGDSLYRLRITSTNKLILTK